MYWEREPFNVKLQATEACSHCKKVRVQKEPDAGFHNIYLDTENWENGSMSMQRMNIHTDMPEGF